MLDKINIFCSLDYFSGLRYIIIITLRRRVSVAKILYYGRKAKKRKTK